MIAWLGVLAGGGLSLFLFTLASEHATVANSDSATVVLEGHSIATGNVLLNGWSLSLDSFWSVDAAFHALFVRVAGIQPILANLVPATIALLVLIIGARIATRDFRGRSAFLAGSTVIALLALPSHALSIFLLQGPWHIGTVLWSLVAFICLRSGAIDGRWIIAVGFLAAGLLGDFQMIALGVVPVFFSGLIAMARTRDWRRGIAALAAAVSSVLLAFSVRSLALHIGAFTYQEQHRTATSSQMFTNVGHFFTWSSALLGATQGPFGGRSLPIVFEIARGIGLVLVVVSLLVGLYRIAYGIMRGSSSATNVAESWRLDDVLVIAIFCDFVLFEVLSLGKNVFYARYLTASIIFGVILAGRTLGHMTHSSSRERVFKIAVAVSLGVIACFGTQVALDFQEPMPSQPTANLAQFLVSHNLRDGIGDYWAASIVTLDSKGAVRVRPIVTNLQHRIVPDGRQADASWYAGKNFEFLVYQSKPYWGVNPAAVIRTFGAPQHVYALGKYFVAVWPHTIQVTGAKFP